MAVKSADELREAIANLRSPRTHALVQQWKQVLNDVVDSTMGPSETVDVEGDPEPSGEGEVSAAADGLDGLFSG